MAKQKRTLPARRRRDDESLLIRSAETLGRMIGSLQRQLDGAGRRLATTADDLTGWMPPSALLGVGGPGPTAGVAKGRTNTQAKSRTSGAAKVRSTADRKSKRAAKSAAARRPAARKKSGATKAARKASRG